MFKKMRGCDLSYDRQGYIYFLCKNYKDLPADEKRRIERVAKEIGGEYSAALFAVLTTCKTIRRISIEYCISETTLYTLRKKFYEEYAKQKKRNSKK